MGCLEYLVLQSSHRYGFEVFAANRPTALASSPRFGNALELLQLLTVLKLFVVTIRTDSPQTYFLLASVKLELRSHRN